MNNLRFQSKFMTIKVYFFAGLIVFCLGLNAQVIRPIPDRPFIESVSVHPETGHVTINWDMPPPQIPPSPLPDRFELRWYETEPSTTHHPFATVSSSTFSYTFDYDTMKFRNPMMPDPRKTSVRFSVVAFQTTATEEVPSIFSLRHNNILVVSKYDSCRSEIKLNWNPYNGVGLNNAPIGWWGNTPPYKPLVSYHVFQSVGGDPYEEIKILSDQDTFFIVPRVKDNDIYRFYIEARRSDGEIASSYRTVRITTMPRPPSFITALGTKYVSDGFGGEVAEVSFKLDPAAKTYSYEFSGSSRREYSFVSLGAFNIHASDTTLTDIQRRGKTHYYKLEAWHVCRHKYTATSNLATALWLTLKQEATENLLFWDPYWEWKDAQDQKINARYEVFRKIGDHPEEVIATVVDPETTAYRDDLSGTFIDGDICYWIVAKPVSQKFPEEMAISNSVCIKPESEIWISQAFTPNVPGIDSEFKPFFSYPPQDYMFVAYDRNGAKVFETKDYNAGWNGQLMNGKPASEGIYTYYLKFQTAMGRLIQKTGTFALILQ